MVRIKKKACLACKNLPEKFSKIKKTDVVYFLSIRALACKNNTSDKVSHAALMIYPRIFGAGQNAQNIYFQNCAL